jgi:alpha-galactosidase
MARTTADRGPVWRSRLPPVNSADSFLTGTNLGVPDELAASAKVAGFSHPGYSADPDMLVVGPPWSEYFANHLAINREIVARDRVTPGRLKKLSDKFTLSDEELSWRANAQPASTESERQTHFRCGRCSGRPSSRATTCGP